MDSSFYDQNDIFHESELAGKIQSATGRKNHNNIITINGFLQNESCYTFIEMPQIRDTWDIMIASETLAFRCFDKVLVFLDKTIQQPMMDDYLALTLHHIEFLQNVFGNVITKSIGLFVVSEEEEDLERDQMLNYFQDIEAS